jgi:hypothetical protein
MEPADTELRTIIQTLEARVAALEKRIACLENPATTLAARKAAGEMEGMSPGWPFWLPAADRRDDYSGLEESDCPRCGHHGQVPRYWHREDPKSYASFAECPQCRHSEPF